MIKALSHPARLIPIGFSVSLTVGTALLLLPVSRAHPEDGVTVIEAAFTAVSSACITGLTVVDTATFWSPVGQGVILGLIQLGGFGVMTLATMLAVLITGRLGLRSTLTAQRESQALTIGDVTGILKTVAVTMSAVEALIAAVLSLRFYLGYDQDVGTALWHGVFHAVSAFNNAGFALYSDNLMGFAADPWVLLPIFVAIVVGGVGFPVYYEVVRRWRQPRRWTLHTKVTLLGYAALLLLGTALFGFFEWGNPGTLGPMDTGSKLLNSVAGGVMPRTAGFNTVDYGSATHETWALNDLLMFVGGGSAGTSGGIKVGTFVLLAFVIWSEVRGESDVVISDRRVPAAAQREALSVALMALGVVAVGTGGLLLATDYSLDRTLFEAVSAFGTTGLSTGITTDLPAVGHLILMALMYIGRVGTITTASALALTHRHRHYHLPEERPIIG